MTLTHRRLIYLSFILAFVIIAPIIALYGGGFRYNFRLHEWQRTGGIVVVAHPREAAVYLDSKLESETIPTRLTKLAPREYELRVALPDYHDWTRQVDVSGSETVFFKDIELFRQDPSLLYIENLPTSVSNAAATSTSLALNGSELNFVAATSTFLLTTSNTLQGATSTLASLPSSEYYFVEGAGVASSLQPDGSQTLAAESGLASNTWLSVYDTRSEILHLLLYNPLAATIERRVLLSPVTNWAWSRDSERLAYHNDFEVWSVDLGLGSQELITRLSSGIDGIAWHQRSHYLMYLTAGKLRAIELTAVGERHNIDILELPEISGLTAGADGLLYLDASVGNQQGWFELKVQ